MNKVVSGRPDYFSALTLEFGALAPKKIGFTGGSDGKESACNSGDLGAILGSGGQGGLACCSPGGRRVGHDLEPNHNSDTVL